MLKSKIYIFVGDCMGKPKLVIWLPQTKSKSKSFEEAFTKANKEAEKIINILEDCIYDRFKTYAKEKYNIKIDDVFLKEWAFSSTSEFYWGDKEKKNIIYVPESLHSSSILSKLYEEVMGERHPALVMNVEQWY